NDRKQVRNQPEAPRKEQAPIRKDRKVGPEASRKVSSPDRKVPEAPRKSPEPVRKPPEKIPLQRPVDRKQPDSRKAPESSPIRPTRKTMEAPRKPDQQATREPQQQAPEPVWKKPPEKAGPTPKPSPAAPVQPARPLPEPTRKPEPKPVKQVPPKPEQPAAAPQPKESKVTTAPAQDEAQPVEVKKVDAWGVQLGGGASRSSLSRGEVRTMKQLERYLEKCVQEMQKAAEVARVIAERAAEDYRKARDLAEKTRTVKGGERLLPKLDRLAEQALLRAQKAGESKRGYLTAADRGV